MDQTPNPNETYLLRQIRLAQALERRGLDALALNPGPSLTYLTGLHFHLMERPVVALFAAGRPLQIVHPELEQAKIDTLGFPVDAAAYGEDPAGWPAAFRKAAVAAGINGKRIGVEPERMRLLEYGYLKDAAAQAEIIAAGEVIADLRLYKDEEELRRMRQAVRIAHDALIATLPVVDIGVTEQEIAAELTLQLLRHGSAPEMPFAPIVSGGPNSANPHASPSDRALRSGDLLVIDWGATFDGYISDLTRTFAIGEVDDECRRIAEIVGEANAAGRATARPGATCEDVDRAAREVIQAAGYGDYFIHRTGHGIGMEGHEHPYIRKGNTQVLEPGMTFTVEPGIYLPGRNGVRIEDNVVITSDGAETLSDIARHLRGLP